MARAGLERAVAATPLAQFSAGAAAVATAAIAFALTAALTVLSLGFAVVQPELRVALETAQALVALLVAFLVHGGARRGGRISHLSMVVGFLLLGGTNLFHAIAHAAFQDLDAASFGRYQAWFPLVLRLIAASLLATAAWCGDRGHRLRREGLTAVGAAVAITSLVALGIAVGADRLPNPVMASGDPGRPELEAHPTLAVAQLVLVAMWAATAAGFARRHAGDARPLHLAVAVGAVLAAFSRVNFALYPSLYTDVVHIGDLFRLAFYLVLAVGAGSEIVRYWRTEAVVDERERLARELHDGLTQDLAFLRSQLSSLAAKPDSSAMMAHLAEAAERALTESRGIVRVLDPGETPPLAAVLGRAARDVADRAGARVVVECDDSIELPAAVVADLGRIVREATSNAVRHGEAELVKIRMRRDGKAVLLAITDDGDGFDPGRARTGYGLRSMRNRASTLGAELQIDSDEGRGTTVEVRLR